jgi:hypothetical protein
MTGRQTADDILGTVLGKIEGKLMKLPSMFFDSYPERSPWQAKTLEILSPLVLRESLLPDKIRAFSWLVLLRCRKTRCSPNRVL